MKMLIFFIILLDTKRYQNGRICLWMISIRLTNSVYIFDKKRSVLPDIVRCRSVPRTDVAAIFKSIISNIFKISVYCLIDKPLRYL